MEKLDEALSLKLKDRLTAASTDLKLRDILAKYGIGHEKSVMFNFKRGEEILATIKIPPSDKHIEDSLQPIRKPLRDVVVNDFLARIKLDDILPMPMSSKEYDSLYALSFIVKEGIEVDGESYSPVMELTIYSSWISCPFMPCCWH
jgi:hypothetical protein